MKDEQTTVLEAKSAELKNLYVRLYVRNKAFADVWHGHFSETVKKVTEWKHVLAEREIHPEEDAKLLDLLITMEDNSVASCKMVARTHGEDLQGLLKDDTFLKLLRNYLLQAENTDARRYFAAMVQRWRELAGGTRVIWNRVAGAATERVSTTVSEGHFNRVYHWLNQRHLLPAAEDEAHDWLAKNDHLMAHFYAVFAAELEAGSIDEKPIDKNRLRQFVWLLSENTDASFAMKKQVVKYGPPGTGKTYLARNECEEAFDCWRRQFAPEWEESFEHHSTLVQFHPSFTYEDFIEGMRPKRMKHGKSELVLQNGVFKSFCRKAAQWEIDLHTLPLPEKSFRDLTITEFEAACRQQLTGKPHWEYLWVLDEDLKNEYTLEEALPPFFFVIDEINRAELSRVFGELMICLEYRGSRGIGRVKTQYAGIDEVESALLSVGGEHFFFIPHNLHLLGTMNTIDRSVESFDFALRRRFAWQHVAPEPRLVVDHWKERGQTEWAGLGDALKRLNKAIQKNKEHLGAEYQIGHAYLMNLSYPTEFNLKALKERVWEDSLESLVYEYLRGCGDEDCEVERLRGAFLG